MLCEVISINGGENRDVPYNTSVKGHMRFLESLSITLSHHNLLLESQHSSWKIMILCCFISGSNRKNTDSFDSFARPDYQNCHVEELQKPRNILLASMIEMTFCRNEFYQV